MLQALLLAILKDKVIELIFDKVTEEAKKQVSNTDNDIDDVLVDSLIKNKSVLVEAASGKIKEAKKRKRRPRKR